LSAGSLRPSADAPREPIVESDRMDSLVDLTSAAPPRMSVADAMHWGLVSCSPDASLRAVAALMSDNQVHCVVVIDRSSRRESPWGVVSDLDLVSAATVRSLDDQTAGGTAMKPAVTVSPGERLDLAAERMTRHGVSHLVVVEPARKQPLGVLSTLDLAGALAAAWSPSSGTNPYFPAPA
jgi:CBS domain-containing protein